MTRIICKHLMKIKGTNDSAQEEKIYLCLHCPEYEERGEDSICLLEVGDDTGWGKRKGRSALIRSKV